VSERPTHLRATLRSPLTMCGIAVHADRALPQMLLRWLPAHRLARARAGASPLVLCERCAREVEHYESDSQRYP
jgi:hypothetical protein